MMGEYTTSEDPKNGDEFWNKTLTKEKKNVRHVEKSLVLKEAKKMFHKLNQFKDHILTIYEVPKAFPTGFVMQPLVKEPTKALISGPAYSNYTVKIWIGDLKNLMKQPSQGQDYEALY